MEIFHIGIVELWAEKESFFFHLLRAPSIDAGEISPPSIEDTNLTAGPDREKE